MSDPYSAPRIGDSAEASETTQRVPRTQRLRDPVHGLITFYDTNPLDQLAWQLIDTPEFQRLRRIKQLGVSEFVYPGATHTRFAHSIGVFHVARQLLKIVKRELKRENEPFDPDRARVAVLAALLHDVGHGPFSHTFEGVQKARGFKKNHEEWSAEIIRSKDGRIQSLLDAYMPALSQKVSALLVLENPLDIYHAIVSSSFDADRLDYLRRDRMMTGTGAGAIDFDWLIEHVRVRSIDLDAVDGGNDGDGDKVPTFCIDRKALPAAEQFLLARYTLHEQVYFHKTTRCIERMIAALLRRVSDLSTDKPNVRNLTGLDVDHPIIQFFSAQYPSVAQYLALDDVVFLGALERLEHGGDEKIAQLARRLKNRELYKTLDCRAYSRDLDWQAAHAKKIDKRFGTNGEWVIKDADARLSCYTQVGGDDEKAHKKLRILENDGKTPEITKFGGIVSNLGDLKANAILFCTTARSGRCKGARSWKMSQQSLFEPAKFGLDDSDVVREATAVSVIVAAGGAVTGRIRLQKLVFLLDKLGLGSGFEYTYHHYGPYSSELAEAMDFAKAFGLVREDTEHRQSDGARYSVYSVRARDSN